MKQVLIRPVITEKTLTLANDKNQYTFIVNSDAGKIEIGNAVARRFDVTVEKVRVSNVLGKKVRWGRQRIEGQRSTQKRAVITLKKGDKINIFDIK